ncbi:OmpA family protein [Flavihumibacter rivuli]|uniref:OmpA family protein n=1 Tax=Flavihumibacter rivuli TaxID=2838156 RepID=UPI001BDDE9B4|nr:OmpA family protein [Flavihumibacter rivuli]ULQ58242.1 OmpA family protein [Flavihumibacter rivuli]
MKKFFLGAVLLTVSCFNSLAQQDATNAGEPVINTFSKFDFIPGEKIVYFNNFSSDLMGELPAGWNTDGSGEVVSIEGFNGKWIKLMQNANFITDNAKPFGTDFTIEFDLLLNFNYQDAMFPPVSFGFLSSGSVTPNENRVLQNLFQYALLGVDLNVGIEQNSISKLVSYHGGEEYFNSGEKPFKKLENLIKKAIHISIQVQKERCRVWINEDKLFDIPKAVPMGASINQLFFRVAESSYTNDQVGVLVSNLKVANGIPDIRKKLVTEGRFSTTGILFDVNDDQIRPESYGALKEIAAAIVSAQGIKVKVIGHTDSDGDDKKNLELSGRRAESVKSFLVKHFGIDPAQLSTEGKGETLPVADNQTREGKAQNRRVELVRLK